MGVGQGITINLTMYHQGGGGGIEHRTGPKLRYALLKPTVNSQNSPFNLHWNVSRTLTHKIVAPPFMYSLATRLSATMAGAEVNFTTLLNMDAMHPAPARAAYPHSRCITSYRFVT